MAHKVIYNNKGTTSSPIIGDIRRATEFQITKDKRKFMWVSCPNCKNGHWTMIAHNKPSNEYCRKCTDSKRFRGRGQLSHSWKGGTTTQRNGYLLIKNVPYDEFYKSMFGKNGYCPEHRLIMARSLGRILQDWEVVHHKNGIKKDNRIDNLELQTRQGHVTDHCKGYNAGFTKGFTDGRSKIIQSLKNEIVMLKSQLREYTNG
jgi:ribosomal protein S27E